MKTRLVLAGLSAWLIVGVAIKHLRYSEPVVFEMVTAEAAMTRHIAAEGWTVADRVALGPDARYGTLILNKADCQTIAVMLVDTSDSVVELFTRLVKGDVAYIENGDVYASPPTARLLLRVMSRSIVNAFGLHARPAFPIVAITPAAAANEGGRCDNGIAARWDGLVEGMDRAKRG